ncbi:MAG: hypothetical protein LUB59_07310 [Candidatus Gastranaerophilales bacterium]|nr:hypothetical protein [Candidatus Gastranaerophilales bacterium]
MRIQRQNNSSRQTPSYKGVLDGAITATLRTLDTNPMANAVGIDLFAMVAPRTYVDTKERNKYAGAETFFREFTGTLIVCLSAGFLAKGISHIANKIIDPKTPVNPNSWFSNDSLNLLNNVWDKSGKNTKNYITTILENTSGLDGKEVKQFRNIDWDNVQWVDEKNWNNIHWDNNKYKNIHKKLKDKNSIISTLTEITEDKTVTKKDGKNLLNIVEMRITNALGAGKATVEHDNKKLVSALGNLLRDSIDLGHDVLTNKNVNSKKAFDKLVKINKIKAPAALAIASAIGLSNQYINRKITEKRTGTKGFVGDKDYNNPITAKKSNKDTGRTFLAEKLAASAGMILMAAGVMKVKSAKDFVKKLEFTGPVTDGNAIKTVYASTLIGRFMASDSKDELRETATRDYLGFLNWLVLGGFAAKGAANLLDKKRKYLFNETKSGKGIKHWLNNISLKSHNEVASKGEKFAKKNMWKLNAAHAAGLAYSTIALGFLLPKLNIFITNCRRKHNNLA